MFFKGSIFMRAVIDEQTCIGCGVCVDVCPEVFEMNEDGSKARVIADNCDANWLPMMIGYLRNLK